MPRPRRAPLTQSYGMTEACGKIVMSLLQGAAFASGADGLAARMAAVSSSGRPFCLTDVRLVDEAGHEVPPAALGRVGELQVRGATVFQGYQGRPEESAAAFAEGGWFRSGDLAVWAPGTACGYLQIVDRAKDMLLVCLI